MLLPLEHSRRNRPAFTLLELLVAMTLVVIVALTLAASLRIGFTARSSSEKLLEAGRSSELVMEFLRNDLQCALPPRGVFAGAFVGTDNRDNRGNDADDLIFYSTAPSPLHPQGGNGEIKQIELTSYQPANSADHVLVRRSLNNLLAPQQEQPDEEVLCRHVSGFGVRYYDGTDWLDNWDSTQQSDSVPMAVEVTLALETADKNADGSPRIARYTRIFQLPCYGQSNDSTSSSSSSSSGSGGTR